MLSGSTRQSIRPFEAAWSFNPHLPILACVRSRDRHSPLSWFVAEGMLDSGNNFSGQLSVTKILQFDRHSHSTVILPKTLLPLCRCKPVNAMQDRPVTQAFKNISTL